MADKQVIRKGSRWRHKDPEAPYRDVTVRRANSRKVEVDWGDQGWDVWTRSTFERDFDPVEEAPE